LSIGQAESYRGYWQSNWHAGSPAWLGTEDPDWAGNYWVNYWDPTWQQIITQYLANIIAAGFDGVYLDRIDAYQESYAADHEDDMVSFVATLVQYARSHSPLGEDFGIIAQNAEDLAVKHPDYVRLVTGIAREEVYVQATDVPTTVEARSNVQGKLDLFLHSSRGHLVLTIDYTSQPTLICTAYHLSRARGYIPYIGPVELDRLQEEPACR
jgi:cysteinyl-tRNA synthetase